MKLLPLLILPIILSACSNASSVSDEPLTSGESRTFQASYDTLKQIVPAAIDATDMHVTSQTENTQGETIIISHAPGAFTWGSVGRVFIEHGSNPDQANKVYALLEGRFGGMEKSSFLQQLFTKIAEKLANNSVNK